MVEFDLFTANTQELIGLPLSFVPSFVIAVAIILAGWLLGWVVEKIVESIFKFLPFVDDAIKSVGFEEITKRAGLRVNLGKFFGVILKIYVIFVFLVIALDYLNLQTVSQFLVNRILDYIPNVVSAALVLIIGLVIANFSARFVSGASRAAKVSGGLASKITKWSIIIFSVIVCIRWVGNRKWNTSKYGCWNNYSNLSCLRACIWSWWSTNRSWYSWKDKRRHTRITNSILLN